MPLRRRCARRRQGSATKTTRSSPGPRCVGFGETNTTTAPVAMTRAPVSAPGAVSRAASTSTTSPVRSKSNNALSARCSGTIRASRPAADSASRGPSNRTSVSTSPRRAGPAIVDPTTPSRLRCVPSGRVVVNRFSTCTSAAVSATPGCRSRLATTASARSPSGSDRIAATPASTTSAAAATRRAATVRDQSGRNAAAIRLPIDGLSDSPTSLTLGAVAARQGYKRSAVDNGQLATGAGALSGDLLSVLLLAGSDDSDVFDLSADFSPFDAPVAAAARLSVR